VVPSGKFMPVIELYEELEEEGQNTITDK